MPTAPAFSPMPATLWPRGAGFAMTEYGQSFSLPVLNRHSVVFRNTALPLK